MLSTDAMELAGEDLEERARRVLMGAGGGSPGGDLAAALDRVEALTARLARITAAAYYLDKEAESGAPDAWFEGHGLDRLHAAIFEGVANG